MNARRRFSDVIAALRHVPDASGWIRTLLELVWALPLILVFAHFGGLVHPTTPPNAITAIVLVTTLFVAPAFGEELLFRGLIIPRDQPQSKWILVSIVLFVLWHPLQAVTVGPPWSSAFLDPWFLAAATVLGTVLARLYVATKSLWPPTLAHWLVVAAWKLFLGGPF